MSPRTRILGWLAVVAIVAIAMRLVRTKQADDPVMEQKPATSNGAPDGDASRVTTVNSPTPPANITAISRVSALSALPLPDDLKRPRVSTVADAMTYLAQLDETDPNRTPYFQALLQFCLQRDSSAATDMAAALADAKLRDLGVGFALLHWGATEPEAAMQWALANPRAENDATRFHTAFEGLAGQTPVKALQALTASGFEGDWDELSRIVMFHCEQQGRLGEARMWIAQLPEGSLRNLLVLQAVRVQAEKSPEEAAAWLASVASDTTFRDGFGALVQSLGQSEPQMAAGLTQQFAEQEIRSERLADLVHVWAKRDMGGAAAWLRAQPTSPHLDAAMARMAEALAPFDRNEAAAWIEVISDADTRAGVRRRLGL